MICRASFALEMGLPSSDTATIPASRMAAISAMASPLLPMLAAPIGQTRTCPWALARSTMNRVIEALSFTGWVLGIEHTTVKPPRAAARVPVSMVSEFSWPGSRRCTCRSIKPGATMKPLASNAAAPLVSAIFPVGAISAMRSPSSRISRGASVPDAGSSTRPFLIRSMSRFLGRGFCLASEGRMSSFGSAGHQQVEDGHAYADPVGDLLENGRARPVGDVRGDFRTAVDGAGMKNQGVGLGKFHALGVQLVEKDVVVLRQGRFVEALGLHAEHDDHVGILEGLLDAVDAANGRAGRADTLELPGNPHGGPAEREAAAEFSEQVDVGPGHAGMRDIAKDGDIQAGERTFAVADREGVEQPLRRMLVRAVSRIHHGNFEMPRHQIGRARRGVAHHETIRLHGIQVVGGVKKRLALLEAGGFGLQVHGVGAEPGGGRSETEPRTRGVFKESQHHGLPAKRGEFFQGIALNLLERLGLI